MSLDRQSVRASYDFYKQNLEGFKDFLTNRGITDFKSIAGDSKSIKQLKEIYNRMTKEFPTITQKAQEAFVAGFEILKNSTNQSTIQAKEHIRNVDLGTAYVLLRDQLAELSNFAGLVKEEDGLGIDPTVLNKILTNSYRDIAGNALELIKVETGIAYLEDEAVIAVETAERAFEITQVSGDKEIKQAAKNTFESVINGLEKIRGTLGADYKINLDDETYSDEFYQGEHTLQEIIDHLKGKIVFLS